MDNKEIIESAVTAFHTIIEKVPFVVSVKGKHVKDIKGFYRASKENITTKIVCEQVDKFIREEAKDMIKKAHMRHGILILMGDNFDAVMMPKDRVDDELERIYTELAKKVRIAEISEKPQNCN